MILTSGSDCKESVCNAEDLGLIPGIGKIPWRREWLSTPVFLPAKFHGQRLRDCKELNLTERVTLSIFMSFVHTNIRRMKGQGMNQEKIFANHISHKQLELDMEQQTGSK